jgi:hypothetical protein
MQNGSNEYIHQYTREQAIEDGQLVDVSETNEAKEAGFKAPLCLTNGVYGLVQVPAGVEGIQDLSGRLWDTLFLAAMAFQTASDKRFVSFTVSYLMEWGRLEAKQLWLISNEWEGFTILLPEEY